MIHIHNNIRFRREQSQHTLTQLARMANVDLDALKQIETGAIEPSLSQAVAIAHALDFPLERLITEDLEQKHNLLKNFECKFLAMDVDGVLTDAGMYYAEAGDELKKFNAKDGLAIKLLTASGIPVGFISSGKNAKTIENRAELLGVERVYVGTWKKAEILEDWCKELNIGIENVAYIGDDLNDMPVIQRVGLAACPADATLKIKEAVHVILTKKGGEGCVREFVDNYIREVSL